MKQAIPNMREIVEEMLASLPSFSAAQQGIVHSFALRLTTELDVLDGGKRAKPTNEQTGDEE